jgi:autotransporter-associated beta strand protein
MRILFLVAAASLVVVPHVLAGELFWDDSIGIHGVRSGDPSGPLLFPTYETRGIAVDAAHDQLLWSDILPLGAPIPGGVIRSGSTAGGEIMDVARGLTSPAGVAFASDRGKVYWTDFGDAEHPSAVLSANLNGTDMQCLISGSSLSQIAGIALDLQRNRLYFTYVDPLIDGLYAGKIARAGMDGSNVETIVDGLIKPLGIAVDSQGGSIFWSDARGLGNSVIEAADLDGKHQRTLLGGLGEPFGVALDLAKQDIYWTDTATGKIQRTVMSGILPFFQDVVTGLQSPTAIVFVPEPVPAPTWSTATSGNWTTGAKWSTGSPPSGAGQQAVVGAATNSSLTITLDGPQTLGTLTFTNTLSNTAGYTLVPGASGTLTMDNSGSGARIYVIDGSQAISAPLILSGDLTVAPWAGTTLWLSGDIMQQSGTHALTLSGPGSLILSGGNSLSGGTIVTAGTLVVTNPAALRDGTGLTVGAEATSIFGSSLVSAPPPASGGSAAVPEPGTLGLLAAGLASLLGYARRRRNQTVRQTVEPLRHDERV